MQYFARICAHARSWREFAKCRFAHFPSFFSVHVDTYDIMQAVCRSSALCLTMIADRSLDVGENVTITIKPLSCVCFLVDLCYFGTGTKR